MTGAPSAGSESPLASVGKAALNLVSAGETGQRPESQPLAAAKTDEAPKTVETKRKQAITRDAAMIPSLKKNRSRSGTNMAQREIKVESKFNPSAQIFSLHAASASRSRGVAAKTLDHSNGKSRLRRDAGDNRLDHLPLGRLELAVGQRLTVLQRNHFVGGVGVVLGRRPNHVEEIFGLDRPHLALRDPATDDPRSLGDPLRQRRIEKILNRRRAAHDLGRPDARGERHRAGEVHFRADIARQGLARIVALVEGRG